MDDQALTTSSRNRALQWRVFLRALADEVDSMAGDNERDDMLRGIGRRMGRMVPLPTVTSLEALEIEMNDALDMLDWGKVRLQLHEGERTLFVVHNGSPRIGSLGSPAGQWLSALLEGLYETWFEQQPGHKASLIARRVQGENPDVVIMRYARG
jgi:hypothetical protein